MTRRPSGATLLVASLLGLSGCYLTHAAPADGLDAGRVDAGPIERFDAGRDAGLADGGLRDAGPVDACVLDPTRCQIVTQLSGLRWELPCGAPVDEDNIVCETPERVDDVERFPGAPGERFLVTLRFRGVVEQAEYPGAVLEGAFARGGEHYGGAWNHYELRVSSPAASYFLNAGTEGEYFCVPIDYVATLEVAGGASLRLLADAIDGSSISNHDADLEPIVVEGVPPAPAAYDGQFIEMDVLEVARL